jgi:S-adenosylmethionine synthetase
MPLLPATYTAESVTSGHPDKVCDQISDAILDACLAQDPTSRVAVECLGSHGLLVIGGEVTTRAEFDAERIARNVYREIGYEDDLEVRAHLTKQSPDIAQGVDPGGAGDQGIMYGYATNETAEYLPRASVEAHRLARTLEQLRKNDATYHWLRPDGKTQITIQHGEITDVLISTQHAAGIAQEEITRALEPLIEPILAEGHSPRFLVNPTGRFVLGGFAADAGLTGRKIMVDTYGGVMPQGGSIRSIYVPVCCQEYRGQWIC